MIQILHSLLLLVFALSSRVPPQTRGCNMAKGAQSLHTVATLIRRVGSTEIEAVVVQTSKSDLPTTNKLIFPL